MFKTFGAAFILTLAVALGPPVRAQTTAQTAQDQSLSPDDLGRKLQTMKIFTEWLDKKDTVREINEVQETIFKMLEDREFSGRPNLVAQIKEAILPLVLAARTRAEAKERQEAEAKRVREAQAAANRKYAAVAISANRAGWALNRSSATEAVDVARAQCGGTACSKFASFSSGCMGIYKYSYRSGRRRFWGYGYSSGENNDEATMKSMNACRDNNRGCVHVTTICQS
jgi:hypothetical protein